MSSEKLVIRYILDAPKNPISWEELDYERKSLEEKSHELSSKQSESVNIAKEMVHKETSQWCSEGWKQSTKVWNVKETDKHCIVYLLTIWSKPTIEHPIPNATAKVWFTVVLDHELNSLGLGYRFESLQQVHVVKQKDQEQRKRISQQEKTMSEIMLAKTVIQSLAYV